MRTSGQRPIPTELHKMRGTYREGVHGRAPIAVGDLSKAPPHFNAEQRRSWRYAIDHAPPHLLKMIDRGTLAVWVEAETRHFEATAEQNRFNAQTGVKYLMPGPMGGLVASPLVDVIDKAGKTMMRASQDLGFSPATRTRIVAPELQAGELVGSPDNNPWAMLRMVKGND
jgi:P27 family predicted phage terminase small subunit